MEYLIIIMRAELNEASWQRLPEHFESFLSWIQLKNLFERNETHIELLRSLKILKSSLIE